MAYCVDIYNFPSSIEYEYKWEGNYGAIDTMRLLIDTNEKYTSRNQRFLRNKVTNTKIFKMSERTRNKEGRNIDVGFLDESHEMKENVIAKPIEQSMSLKDEPLFVNLTTEGFTEDGYLDEELVKARKIISGEDDGVSAIRTLPWLYTQDSEQEVWQNRKSWFKSNPSLGIVKKWDYLDEQIDQARKSKADRIYVLCKDFNIKQNSAESWLNLQDYDYPAKFDIEAILSRRDMSRTHKAEELAGVLHVDLKNKPYKELIRGLCGLKFNACVVFPDVQSEEVTKLDICLSES